jgi:hypothetical protein
MVFKNLERTRVLVEEYFKSHRGIRNEPYSIVSSPEGLTRSPGAFLYFEGLSGSFELFQLSNDDPIRDLSVQEDGSVKLLNYAFAKGVYDQDTGEARITKENEYADGREVKSSIGKKPRELPGIAFERDSVVHIQII